MKWVRVVGVVACLFIVAGLVWAKMEPADQNYLNRLLEGNQRCVADQPLQKDIGSHRRQELAGGQHPFATVITCSDSRVVPEFIFDQGLGDIFVVRVAGNVVEPTTLGSIEYAAEHLHTPLLIIMGHEKCGAVSATLEATGKPEGNIGAIIKKIMPAAKVAKKQGGDKETVLEAAIHENIRNTYKDVMRSKVVSHLVKEGKLKIVAAEYYIGTGKTRILDLEGRTVSNKGVL